MLLSLAHLTLNQVPPPELVAIAAETGFDAVGLRLGRGARSSDPTWPMLGDTPMLRETRERLADTGLQVLEAEGVSILPGRSIGSFRQLPALIEAAAELSAHYLAVAAFDPNKGTVAEQLAELCELCRPAGLVPVVEFMSRSAVRNLSDALDLVQQPGCESAGVVLDTLHFFRSGGSVADLERADHRRIHLIQLSDASKAPPPSEQDAREESRNRLLPGQGDLPLADVLAAASDVGWISMEVPDSSCAHSPLEMARQVMLAAQQLLARGGEAHARR